MYLQLKFLISDQHTENIKRVLREYHTRIAALEDKKFDIEYLVKKKDYEVHSSKKKEKKLCCLLWARHRAVSVRVMIVTEIMLNVADAI